MAMVKDPRSVEGAIVWIIRLRDPAFADWQGFTAWLESNDDNAAAYAELSVREEAVAKHLSASASAGETWVNEGRPACQRTQSSRRGWIAGLTTVAASALVAFGAYQLIPGKSPYIVQTPPGMRETLTLAGGTTISLSGATVIELDGNDSRYAAVKTGEALFDVIHDPDHPFRVEVGESELVDLGTRFNVVRDGEVIEVGVAEGVVLYNAGSESIRLIAGRQLRADHGNATVGQVPTDSVGSWAQGRLIYDNAPLAEVAADLSRVIGKRVRVDPALANRPVTAVVQLPSDRRELARHIEKLLDVKVNETPTDWTLTAR